MRPLLVTLILLTARPAAASRIMFDFEGLTTATAFPLNQHSGFYWNALQARRDLPPFAGGYAVAPPAQSGYYDATFNEPGDRSVGLVAVTVASHTEWTAELRGSRRGGEEFTVAIPVTRQPVRHTLGLTDVRLFYFADPLDPAGFSARSVWFDDLELTIAGDVNGDALIDLVDLNAVRNQFGEPGTADLNGDGLVGLADLNEVRNSFAGQDAVPVPEPPAGLLALAALAMIALTRVR